MSKQNLRRFRCTFQGGIGDGMVIYSRWPKKRRALVDIDSDGDKLVQWYDRKRRGNLDLFYVYSHSETISATGLPEVHSFLGSEP